MRPGLLALLVLTACGPGPVATVAHRGPELLPLAAGQSWKMADGAGRLSSFAVADGGAGTLRVRITKTDPAAYWWPGVDGAQVDFYLRREGGTWSSPRSDVSTSGGPAAVLDVVAVPGLPLPYRMFPPGGAPGVIDTAYDLQTRCAPPCPAVRVSWHSDTYRTTVARWGEVTASHYCEGQGCLTEETWFFRAGVGVVRIETARPVAMALDRIRGAGN